MQYESVWNYVDSYPVEQVLKDLVAIDTQNPPGNERTAVCYILSRLKDRKVEIRIIEHGNNRASLAVKLIGKSPVGTAFLGHLDTVPAGDLIKWTHPPLESFTNGDTVYGRGTADMKGGLTAMLILLDYLLDNQTELPNDVYFFFTADEETGFIGISAVNESGLLDNVSEIIVGEPTGCKIALAEKGAIWVKLTATGRQAHGALPDTGINAIEILCKYIELAKQCPFEKENPLLGRSTISTTSFNGGVKSNIIPSKAEAILDIRTICVQHHELVRKHLDCCAETVKTQYKADVNVEIQMQRFPLFMDETAAFVKRIDSACAETGRIFEHIGLHYFTDLAECLKDKKKDFVILGPGEMDSMHANNEHVSLESIKEAARIYITYILNKQ